MARYIKDYDNRKYLKKEDLPNPVVLTITHVTDDEMQDGSIKPAAHFKGDGYLPALLNKTNREMIALIAGSENIDEWGGTQVEFFNDEAFVYQGSRGAIRCRRPSVSEASEVDDDLPESFT